MPSIDTVLTQVTNSAALAAVTVANGDSLTVRSFASPATARLTDLFIKGGQAVQARVTSPYLADTTRGITVTVAQVHGDRVLPKEAAQALSSQDTLVLQANSGAANSSIVALANYYSDLGASNARLHMWGDIAGIIANIKPLEVDAAASATIGQWTDTAITTTENLLKANTDYAVLGFLTDVAVACVGVRGQDTGSLRICGPAGNLAIDTSSYFVDRSNELGIPYIPVINAANAGNTGASVADNAASTAVKVQLILAELSQNLPN